MVAIVVRCGEGPRGDHLLDHETPPAVFSSSYLPSTAPLSRRVPARHVEVPQEARDVRTGTACPTYCRRFRLRLRHEVTPDRTFPPSFWRSPTRKSPGSGGAITHGSSVLCQRLGQARQAGRRTSRRFSKFALHLVRPATTGDRRDPSRCSKQVASARGDCRTTSPSGKGPTSVCHRRSTWPEGNGIGS